MNEMPRKRRRQRAVLSCNDCRRRKLKCDRELPCNRCVNGGIAQLCAYGLEAHTAAMAELQKRQVKKQRQPTNHRESSIIEEKLSSDMQTPMSLLGLEKAHSSTSCIDHFAQLEHQADSGKKRSSMQQDISEEDTSGLGRELSGNQSTLKGLLKGRSYATFFYGSSSALSITAHFADLRYFMQDIYQNSTAQRLAQDMKAFENRAQPMKATSRVLSITNLRSLLPPKVTVDILIQQYMDTYETTYRVVHLPTFKAAYEEYWNYEGPANQDLDALVLAMLACTICPSSQDSPRYNHNGSTFHSKAILWIKSCEAWLKRQSNKHRTITSLQVRCLRLIALSATSQKVKEYYQEVQAHMAFMRSAGMHRDPSIFGSRCSIFEGEMRRRLWATSVELEFQASIDQGIPSVLSSFEYDCAAPRNINDIDLYVGLKELPSSQSVSIFTDTSFSHFSMSTIKLRTRISALANSLKPQSTFQDVLQHIESIQRCLQGIPTWTDSKSFQARTLLDLQLRQLLLILYTSTTLETGSGSGLEARFLATASLEACAKIIDLHTEVLNRSNSSLCCTRNDYHRAALLLCYIAYNASKTSDVIMAQISKATCDKYLPKALHLQEERVMRSGRGGQYHWHLSAAAGLVSVQFAPSQLEAIKLQVIDRVSGLLYKILSLKDDPCDESLANEVVLENLEMNTASNDNASSLSAEAFTSAGLRLEAFDAGSTSEWMLDDFWFSDVPLLDFSNQSCSEF